ncbi:hypothetical protein E4U43_000857 [Claviceps pusilla]|uniref:Uncharacterized protein n=1 Tax=Claviceps pusilla TaxID=123648 RepID=A0A9P7NB74_9HYPO|nr:hypothetical protein E4U43_000857 [Claviceps pusilla]
MRLVLKTELWQRSLSVWENLVCGASFVGGASTRGMGVGTMPHCQHRRVTNMQFVGGAAVAVADLAFLRTVSSLSGNIEALRTKRSVSGA